MTDTELAVVGGGLMGAATAWAAARRGRAVTVLEQFAFGHDRGSSHGSARIVRRAYPDPLYVRLTGRAMRLWRELEYDSGSTLVRLTGGVDHGPGRDPAALAGVLADAGVLHELLPAREAERRWPGMRFDGPVLFHPEAGTVDADAALAAFLRTAAGRGAELRPETPVLALEPHRDHVVLRTPEGELTARRAVVAAGAWAAPLLAGLAELPPLTVTQQQVFHFPRHDTHASPWPVAIHQGPLSVYSLPGGRDGGPHDGRKIAEHDAGRATTARDRDGLVDAAARERITRYVEEWLPGLDPVPFNETTCLYTSTPNEDFVLDRHGPLVLCSPCSGHGAKFAPLIGELTVDLATGTGRPEPRFSLAAHLGRSSGPRGR